MIDDNVAKIVAAFIDKRGCFYYRVNEKGHHFHTFKISTINGSIVKLLHRLTNMGYIREDERNGKKVYTWFVHSKIELYHLLKNVIPYLNKRRKNAEEMLNFLRYKRKRHRFSSDNTRKVP